MSDDNVKRFYEFICREKSLQSQLIDAGSVASFIDVAIGLGKKHGYIFSKEEMSKTMNGIPNAKVFKDIDFDDPWAKKILEIGWVPLGYTR